jgi:hypothetical protein
LKIYAVLQPFKGLRHRVSLQSDSSRICAGFRAFRLGEKAICVSSVSVNLQSFRRSVMSRASYHSLPVAGSRRYYVILCAEKACPTCLWNDNETHRKCSRAPASLFTHLSFLTPEPLIHWTISCPHTDHTEVRMQIEQKQEPECHTQPAWRQNGSKWDVRCRR